MSSFISQNLTEIEAVTGCIFTCICHTVFGMFSCLQINWQPFYPRQILKFHPFDWLIDDQNLSSNRGPGYSPQNGIAPTNACFFPSVFRAVQIDHETRGTLGSAECFILFGVLNFENLYFGGYWLQLLCFFGLLKIICIFKCCIFPTVFFRSSFIHQVPP